MDFNFQNRFRFSFLNSGYLDLDDSVVGVSLPGLTMGVVEQPTPMISLFNPGDSLEYTEITLKFLLDEDYNNWRKLFKWIYFIKNPAELDSALKFSDATIHLLDNKYKAIFILELQDIFPYTIDPIELSTQIDTAEEITFNVSFKTNGVKLDELI
jgi:hypothetical protein